MPSMPDRPVGMWSRTILSDPSLYEQSIQPWEVVATPTARGAFRYRREQVLTPGFALYRESIASATRVQGALPAGLLAFSLPIGAPTDSQIWGEHDRRDRLRCMASGGLDMRVPTCREHVVVIAEEAVLRRRLPDEAADVLVAGAERRALHVPQARLETWAAQAWSILRKARAPSISTHDASHAAETGEQVLALLQAIAASSAPRARPLSTAKRRQAVLALLAFVDKSSDCRLPIEMMCEVAGVSRRTLEYAVREHLGASVRAFLHRVRLHRIRRDLLHAKAGTVRVLDIAGRHGLPEVGRFAASYRREFGELPSATLRKAPPPRPRPLRAPT